MNYPEKRSIKCPLCSEYGHEKDSFSCSWCGLDTRLVKSSNKFIEQVYLSCDGIVVFDCQNCGEEVIDAHYDCPKCKTSLV